MLVLRAFDIFGVAAFCSPLLGSRSDELDDADPPELERRLRDELGPELLEDAILDPIGVEGRGEGFFLREMDRISPGKSISSQFR